MAKADFTNLSKRDKAVLGNLRKASVSPDDEGGVRVLVPAFGRETQYLLRKLTQNGELSGPTGESLSGEGCTIFIDEYKDGKTVPGNNVYVCTLCSADAENLGLDTKRELAVS